MVKDMIFGAVGGLPVFNSYLSVFGEFAFGFSGAVII